MLVYGDHAEQVDPRQRLAELEACTGRRLSHDALTDLFVDAAGLAQGLADADFADVGEDRSRPAEMALLDWLTKLAAILLRSWDDGHSGGEASILPPLSDLPEMVSIKLPEGYAFYALRPEAFGLAARQLELSGVPRVIGLRSIGSGLACIAAAALQSPPPITLRPTGDPFNRRPRVAHEWTKELLAGEPHFIIVDEGPGLSGSSLGGTADWLEEQGVPTSRISFLPSHAGDLGKEARPRHRRRWSTANRPVVTLDRPRREWIEALIGPIAEWTDVSRGQWRPLWSASEAEWPPIDPMWERRKFLARTNDGDWLVKWMGLGRAAQSKLDLARQLGDWFPEVRGATNGWIVTRWHDDAAPTRPTLDELIGYLRARAALPASTLGACLETLVTMVRRNAVPDWSPDLGGDAPRPVLTDNRMAAHEWLRLPSGKLLKADALDHHQGHDLIGCQDIAWDVAGAAVELDLSAVETDQVRSALDVSPALLAITTVAYRAFRLGAHRMSAASLDHWPREQQRHDAAADAHAAALARIDAVEHAGDVR